MGRPRTARPAAPLLRAPLQEAAAPGREEPERGGPRLARPGLRDAHGAGPAALRATRRVAGAARTPPRKPPSTCAAPRALRAISVRSRLCPPRRSSWVSPSSRRPWGSPPCGAASRAASTRRRDLDAISRRSRCDLAWISPPISPRSRRDLAISSRPRHTRAGPRQARGPDDRGAAAGARGAARSGRGGPAAAGATQRPASTSPALATSTSTSPATSPDARPDLP